jgi:hypothetical protein
MEAVRRGEICIKAIPTRHRFWTAEEITHFTISHVPPELEQRQIELWLVPPKARAPNPRLASGSLFGRDDFARHSITLKIKEGKPMKVTLFARKFFRLRKASSRQKYQPKTHAQMLKKSAEKTQ